MRREIYLIAVITVSLFSFLQIVSCAADPSDASKSPPADAAKSASAASPSAAASTAIGGPAPAATTTDENRNIPPVKSYPPDTTNYTRPLRPGDRVP
jgi:hypothetical protein